MMTNRVNNGTEHICLVSPAQYNQSFSYCNATIAGEKQVHVLPADPGFELRMAPGHVLLLTFL